MSSDYFLWSATRRAALDDVDDCCWHLCAVYHGAFCLCAGGSDAGGSAGLWLHVELYSCQFASFFVFASLKGLLPRLVMLLNRMVTRLFPRPAGCRLDRSL